MRYAHTIEVDYITIDSYPGYACRTVHKHITLFQAILNCFNSVCEVLRDIVVGHVQSEVDPMGDRQFGVVEGQAHGGCDH